MAGKWVKMGAIIAALALTLFLVGFLAAVLSPSNESEEETPLRSDVIPTTAVKQTPATDIYPPILRSDEWLDPIPLPGPVNTAGAEDSPFIAPNGTWFFFFFTPDLNIPIQQQLGDKVTGVWWSKNVNGTWTEPEKLILGTTKSLDGDEFVLGNTLWFASVREGNLGEIDIFTAQYLNGKWRDVENCGQELNVEMDIGAFCFTPGGSGMYYEKNGDIMYSVYSGSEWSTPQKVANLDGVTGKNQPFITADGQELWFTGNSLLGRPGPALFRCEKNGSSWDAPEEIVSQFAGEPNLDADGNLYFVHHYVTQNISLIEADIYVAYRNTSYASSLALESLQDEDGQSLGSAAASFAAVRRTERPNA